MSSWQRDVIAVLGVAFIAWAGYLVYAALAPAIVGAALLWLWNRLVAEGSEDNDGS